MREILEKIDPEEYKTYFDKAFEAVQKDAGKDKVSSIEFANLYDIAFIADGEEIEPDGKVKVTISYDQALDVKEADQVRVIHFTRDGKTGEVTAELLKNSDVQAHVCHEKMDRVKYDADSISVFAVVCESDKDMVKAEEKAADKSEKAVADKAKKDDSEEYQERKAETKKTITKDSTKKEFTKKEPEKDSSEEDAFNKEESVKDASKKDDQSAVVEPGVAGSKLFIGDGFGLKAIYDEKAGIPKGADLFVREIKKKSDKEEYQKYYEETLRAIQDNSDAASMSGLSFAKFYDITFSADGEEIEPDDTVQVTISYDEALKAKDPDHVRIIHFAENKKGRITAEVLDPSDVRTNARSGKMSKAAFRADSFSVYAVVYTVDYEYEVDGKKYRFSMNGEDAVSLRDLAKELHLYEGIEKAGDAADEKLERFIDAVEDVKFSNPKLLAVVKAEEDTTLGKLKAKNKISQDFAAWKNQGEVEERNSVEFKEGDWALISLKPFDTKEKLTITLDTEEEIVVTVTDAQDANMKADGVHVDTVPNPAGTRIDLYNYWIDDSLKNKDGREAWPGYYDGWYYHDENDYEWYKNGTLLGTGNDAGINAGHMFKFSPAWAGTVYNGTIPNVATGASGQSPTRNPTNVSYTNDGDRLYYTKGVNSYTGSGDPTQGLVEGTLVGGYPKLTTDTNLGTDGESLEYLFKQENGAYRDYYEKVNHLLYVDKDGYYTYDSRDYAALLNGTNFELTEQTSDDTEVRGFWPFGQQRFWVGMHMQTQFSMPESGQVLNPKEEYKDMQFEFSGDDDTWLYVDGVLVGDGGGVHNRTEIDINFAKGKVTVTGKKDANHMGSFEETKWLDDIFKDAGKYNEDDWEDIPGDDGLDEEGNRHKRFKPRTYHTFDMYYLERGGGESNLYIHYNLVSTEDFTGHKSYEGFADDERMSRDQFQFEMIGLDGQYQSVWDEETQTATVTKLNDDGRAIMPTGGSADGAGTFADPNKNTAVRLIRIQTVILLGEPFSRPALSRTAISVLDRLRSQQRRD